MKNELPGTKRWINHQNSFRFNLNGNPAYPLLYFALIMRTEAKWIVFDMTSIVNDAWGGVISVT